MKKPFNSQFKKASGRITLLTMVLFFATALQLRAQNVDLQAVSIDPTLPTIGVGQVGQIVVAMKNNGPSVIPVGEATAQITLSSVFLDLAIPFNFTDACGQWTYLGNVPGAGTHNLFFQNNAGPIPVGGPFCSFQFNIAGKMPTVAPSGITLASSLSAGATTSDVDGSNQAATTEINVTAFVLPVVLSDFNVTASSCNGILNWRTASEQNVKNFEVEYSANGTQFTVAGTVLAKNASEGAVYRYVNAQGTGKGYYRLKIVDVDGHVGYSRVVSVDTKCNGTKSVSLYPNPLTANQNLSVIISGYEGSIKGELVSMTGQVIRTYSLKNGTNTLPVDKVAQATYMMRVTDAAGETESFRVIIVK
jgi:hypothetical protein